MTRRPYRTGTTLMEVLIATAILAIGLLAILALFPIGAVNMARAINQNRAADHAQNSDALFRLYWKRAWIDPNGGGVRPSGNDAAAASNEEMIVLLDRPRGFGATPMIPATSSQPSFIVFVDPVGWRTQLQNGVNNQLFVAGSPTLPPPTNLPVRCNLAATPAGVDMRPLIRNTTMLDDMTYDLNGEPSDLGTGQLQRAGRYSTAWMIQRPKNNVPHEVNLTVVIYAGRSPTDTPSAETPYQAEVFDYLPAVDPKPRSMVVTYDPNVGKPGFTRGKWVAFSTPIQPQPAPPAGTPPGTPGYGVPYMSFDFYRIAAVTDLNDTQMSLEVEQPLRTYETNPNPQLNPLVNWNNGRLTGVVVFFDNLFEVFERGTVSAAGIAGR